MRTHIALFVLLASSMGCARPASQSMARAAALDGPLVAARAESLAVAFSSDRANLALLRRALSTSDSALSVDSTLATAHAARAIAYAAAGRPRDAAAAYRHVLALNAEYPRAANAAIGQFWRAGYFDEAYRWGKRQAEREPTNISVLFNYQVAAAFLMEPALAESLMHRALAVNPRYATGHGELAFLAMYAGRIQDAVKHMESALIIDSASSLNRGGLAQMLVAAGEPARAAELLAPIVAKDSNATAYGGRSMLAIYGWALLAAGDTAAAMAAFDQALRRLERRQAAGETTYQLFRELAAVRALRGERHLAVAALSKAADAGMHTYASWDLSDPMFESIRTDPAVQHIVARMQADTRRQRRLAGLSSAP